MSIMSWQNNEKKYLQALVDGDREAFAAIYERYAGKCLRFVISLTNDEDLAKDITHDVFIKVWKYRKRISGIDSFNSYLFRMMKNAVLDASERDHIARLSICEKYKVDNDEQEIADDELNADTLRRIVLESLNGMPDQRRKVFMMSRFKGVSNAEIAERMGLSIRTVEKHISNALVDVRRALKKNFYFLLIFLRVFVG